MDSSKLNDWLQIIGLFTLVASLIFVGMQVRQAQNIAIAGHYLDQAALVVESRGAAMQNEALMQDYGQRILASGRFPEFEELDPRVLAARVYVARNALTMIDNDHFQYTAGFQSEEAWQSNRRILKEVLTGPYGRYVFEEGKDTERASFLAVCEELLREIESAASD